MNRWILVLSLLVLCSSLITAEETIRIRPKQGVHDISHDYFSTLLQKALDKTTTGNDSLLVVETLDMTQERALVELEQGQYIDIDWAGTTIEREQRLLPIRIPLAGGLLGYRVPVIRTEDTVLFNEIRDLAGLKKYTSVQGTHWPDADILEAAGLKVTRVPQFKSMYPMLLHKRIDYFPRGLQEVYSEVSSIDSGVVVYDQLLIVYTFPMYFFVQKENTELARRVEKGLRMMIDDGSFLKHMKKHPVTESLFPLSRYRKSRTIKLDNPFLSPETPLNDSTLWLRL